MVLRAAASRDPRRFECPAQFQVERPNARQHIMFGHGIHTCPGAPLARSEARVILERFFDRTEHIDIDESVHGPAGARHYDFLPSYMFRGLTNLHITYR
jgi:cytochrome P450